MIVEGMYDRRRELSLVPAYEMCVCECVEGERYFWGKSELG